MTVFLTTHYMEEATDADFIIIIEKGKIITEGTPLDLKNKYAKDTISIYNVEEKDVMKLKLPYTKIRDSFKLEVDNTSVATDLIIKNKDIFKDHEIIKGKMDDVFLNATGNELGALNEKIINLTIRNIKVYFSDKGMFFTSLITPAILLVLYSTFLANVYKDAFINSIPVGIELSSKLLNGLVSGQLVGSLLSVSCITVAFCSNMLMV